MATKSRASFEKRSREIKLRKKREDKMQRRQERRESKLNSDGDDTDILQQQDIDMEGLFGYGSRAPENETPPQEAQP